MAVCGCIYPHIPPSGSPGIYALRGGSVGRISVPAPHPDKCLSYKGGVQCEEGLDSASCLLHPSFLIRAEAHVYLLAEFLDGPLGPLRERSFPSTNGRPSLITNPSLPHLLTQGGAWGSGY